MQVLPQLMRVTNAQYEWAGHFTDIQNNANEKNITLIRVYSLAEITIRE